MLNAMRFGKLNDDAIQAFRNLSRPVKYDDGIGPTQLYGVILCCDIFGSEAVRYPTRAEVDRANQARLISLPGNGIRYQATDTPGRDSNDNPVSLEHMGRLLERLVAQQVIHLKVVLLQLFATGCLTYCRLARRSC